MEAIRRTAVKSSSRHQKAWNSWLVIESFAHPRRNSVRLRHASAEDDERLKRRADPPLQKAQRAGHTRIVGELARLFAELDLLQARDIAIVESHLIASTRETESGS
jgi:hypothetical protein